MEHSEAMKLMAAERYTLGELEPAERDAFEEHFFDCVECSGDVRDETKIAATVRLGEPHVASLAPGRRNWWVAACVLLAGGLGYQTFVAPQIAERRHSQAPTARVIQGQMLVPDSRGAGTPIRIVIAPPDEPVHIDVPFVPTVPGPYRGEIRDERARQVGDAFDVPVPTDEALALFVPAGTLHYGKCTLVIRGAGGQEASSYRFEVQPK